MPLSLWSPARHAQPVELLHAAYTQQRFPPHAHDTFAIGVVESGTSVTRYRGGTDVHAPGRVIVIEPGEMHTGEPRDAGGWTYRMLYPSIDQLAAISGVSRSTLADGGLFERSYVDDPALARRLAAAHASCNDDALTESLGALLQCHARRTVRREVRTRPELVRVVCAYVHEHHAAHVTLGELASLVSLSPFHLIRVFRRAMGVPPYTYLALVRVQRARELLRAGSTPGDAARATGFCDQSHLTRTFRRVTGVTPGVYARSYRGARA